MPGLAGCCAELPSSSSSFDPLRAATDASDSYSKLSAPFRAGFSSFAGDFSAIEEDEHLRRSGRLELDLHVAAFSGSFPLSVIWRMLAGRVDEPDRRRPP
jgi:hypothetical protein